MAPSTVGRSLQQAGPNRSARLQRAPPIRRYEHAAPGDLLHLGIEKRGLFWQPGHRVTTNRTLASDGTGWERIHVAIDDHSRATFSGIEPGEQAVSA